MVLERLLGNNVPTPTEGIAQASGSSSFSHYFLWFVAVVGALGCFWWWYREHQIFRFKAQIERRRGEDKRKIVKGKCGYLMKNGVRSFIIKWGLKPTNRKVLDYIPDTRYLDGDTFYFDQLDPDTYVQKKIIRAEKRYKTKQVILTTPYEGYAIGDILQLEETIADSLVNGKLATFNGDAGAIAKETTESNISYEPIPRENKIIFVTYAKGVQGALNVDSKKVMTMFIIGMVVLGIVLLAALAILRK